MTGRERIQRLAAAGAAVAALAATAAAPASAGSPVGEQLAAGVLQQPVIDDDTGRIGYVVAPGTVRLLDLASGATRDFDVRAGCDPHDGWPLLTGAGQGQLLLACETRRTVAWPGREPYVVTETLPRLLDEHSAAITQIPNAPLSSSANAITVVRAGVVFNVPASGRDPAYEFVVNVSTGAFSAWHGEGAFDAGFGVSSTRGLANTKPLTATFHDCPATLTWTVGGLAEAQAMKNAVLVSDAAYGEGPLTLTRVPLGDDVCARTLPRWQVRASARGRTVVTATRSAAVPDRQTGAVASVDTSGSDVAIAAARAPAPRLRATRGGRVRLRAASTLDGLRWRVAGGRWRAASGDGRSWAATLPRGLRGTRALELETRLAGGGTVRHALRLTVVGR